MSADADKEREYCKKAFDERERDAWILNEVLISAHVDTLTNVELVDRILSHERMPWSGEWGALLEAAATRLDPTWTTRHAPADKP